MFQHDSKGFLRRYVTVDETWIHYHMPERKNHLKMWTEPGKTRFFPWFCFNNSKFNKLNPTDCKKISNQHTDLKLCIRTHIRWDSLRIVTYLR